MANLTIPYNGDKDKLKKIMQIEKLLAEIGVTFDTGMDGKNRDWHLDWSLKGAIIK
jgi:hypothetical protein